MTDADPAWEIVHEAILAYGMKVPDLGRARRALLRVIREGAWKHYMPPIGEACEPKSFAEWATAKIPRGLETPLQNLIELAEGDTVLKDALDKALQGKHGGDHGNQYTGGNVDNIHVGTARPSGTSESAALRRLRQQYPDLHTRVLNGELTAHAAAIEAGFRKRTITVRTDDPAKIAATLRRQLEPWTLYTVLKLLTTEEG